MASEEKQVLTHVEKNPPSMMFTGVHIAIAIFFVVWYAVHRLRDGFWAAMEARGIGYRARAAAADDATEGDKEEV